MNPKSHCFTSPLTIPSYYYTPTSPSPFRLRSSSRALSTGPIRPREPPPPPKALPLAPCPHLPHRHHNRRLMTVTSAAAGDHSRPYTSGQLPGTTPSSSATLFPTPVERTARVAGGGGRGSGDLDERGDDAGAQDVGNVVALEHLNLEVPDLEVARLFYGEALGLTADPDTVGAQRGGTHVVWYNCGRQQFHIARGPAAQVLRRGSVVGLVLPDMAEVAARVEAVRGILGDVSLTHTAPDTLEIVDPYGNTFVVHASLPYFPARAGLAYLQLPCFPGTAPELATFYAGRLGARVRLSEGGSGGGGVARVEVCMGVGQRLVFVEQMALGPVSEQAVASMFSGWHIALYVADFSRTYRALHHHPDRQPFNEHPYRDKFYSLRDALRNHQFRFQDIFSYDDIPYDTAKEPTGVLGAGRGPGLSTSGSSSSSGGIAAKGDEPEGGGGGRPGQGAGGVEGGLVTIPRLLYRISHEVRSMYNPLYGRPLYGRGIGYV